LILSKKLSPDHCYFLVEHKPAYLTFLICTNALSLVRILSTLWCSDGLAGFASAMDP